MIYKMTLKDSVDTMTFNLLETPIVDKDIEGAVDNVTLDGNQYTDYLYLKKQYIQKWAIMCPDEYDELRGFYTRQFEDGEVPSYRVYYGANVTRDYAFNGDYFQFNAEGIETGMTLSQLLGNAEQDGTPTPDSPVPISVVTGEQTIGVTGKNLFDKNDATDNTGLIWNTGNTFVENKSVTSGFISVKITQTYTSSHFAGIFFYDANKVYLGALQSDNTSIAKAAGNIVRTFTVPNIAGIAYTRLSLRSGSNDNIDMTQQDIQLELGSTATAYEPYHGQSHEVNLGKNLFDASNTNTLALGTNTLVTNAAYRGYALRAAPGATYTLSRASTSTPPRFMICFTKELPSTGVSYYDQNSSLGGSINANSLTSTTFTVPSDMNYIFIYLSNNGTLIDESMKIQLERGSRATTYAPYFTPIELAKIGTYQDRIYKDEGKWYIEKQVGKVVLDGTEAWGYNGTDRVFVVSNLVDYMRTGFVPMSDYYTGQEITAYSQLQDMHIAFLTGTNSRTVVKNTNYTTANDFKTWLSTHSTTVYYALATPTTTEITDETLLLQLNFLASLYGGVNNISLVGTGAQGEMEVFIRDVMSVETDVVPEVPVRLTLTDDGVINACGCRRNVQLTMRETTE